MNRLYMTHPNPVTQHCFNVRNLETTPFSPVEFGRNLGRPRKNLYKDILYTVGKIILSAFQW